MAEIFPTKSGDSWVRGPGIRQNRLNMPVRIYRIPAGSFVALAGGPLTGAEISAFETVRYAVADLLAAAADVPDGFPPLAAQGLAADLRGRRDRTVRAWAAVRGDGSFAGLISLATAVPPIGDRRYSIPWLVVDPRERRQGVGAGLVRRALYAAAHEGVRDVAVETLARWQSATSFWDAIARTTGGNRCRFAASDSAEPFLEPEA